MNEFAATMRRQAVRALRVMFQHDPGQGTDPMLELIAFSSGGTERVGFLPPPNAMVTTEQWLTWNRLVQGKPAIGVADHDKGAETRVCAVSGGQGSNAHVGSPAAPEYPWTSPGML